MLVPSLLCASAFLSGPIQDAPGEVEFVSIHSAFAPDTRGVLLFGDVTGDGLPDRLEWDEDYVNLYLVPGDPDGLFAFERELIGPFSATGKLIDVDSDGDLDVLAVNGLLKNDGTGGFVDASANVPNYGFSSKFSTGDLDGDGDPDMIQLTSLSTLNRVLINDGTGVFTQENGRFPAGFRTWGGIQEMADVDGDGDLDVVNNYPQREIELFVNDGTGHFTSAPPLPAVWEGGIALEDYDQDGDVDIFAREPLASPPGYQVLENDGTGTFTRTRSVPFGSTPRFLDANGDGRLDALATGPSGRTELFLGAGAGIYHLTPGRVPIFGVPLDLDADGDADIAGTWIALGDGQGNFVDVVEVSPNTGIQTGRIDAGDIDGDGDVDLLSCAPTHLTIERNTGTTEFVTEAQFEGNSCIDMELFDGDGDGDLDLVLISTQVWFAENTGDGTFEIGQSLSFASLYYRLRQVGDFDGDGHPDLLFLDESIRSQPVLRLYRNDGSGVFTESPIPLALQAADPTILSSDFDGDGVADALVLYDTGIEDELYLNDGAGVFTLASGNVPAKSSGERRSGPRSVDIDRDGDLDLVLVANQAPQGRIWINDGAGVFTDESFRWNVGGVAFPIQVAEDLSGDGFPDLATSSQLWVNDGVGAFPAPEPLTTLAQTSNRVVAADVDADGDLDIFSNNPRILLYNAERQLSWRAVPRIGKPLSLDLRGDAGASWMLFSAASLGEWETDFGLFRLGSGFTLQGSGSLDAQGFGTKRFDLPPLLELVGRELFWQALVGDPLRFTNVERTALTSL